MQSAAGGTSQRLKPAFAIVCSRSRIPIPPPDIVLAPLIVALPSSPAAALAGHVCRPRLLLSIAQILGGAPTPRIAAPHNSRVRPDHKSALASSNPSQDAVCPRDGYQHRYCEVRCPSPVGATLPPQAL